MFYITHNTNKFIVEYKSDNFLAKDEFQSITDFLRLAGCSYNKTTKINSLSEEKVDAFCLWCELKKWKYYFDDSAFEKFNEIYGVKVSVLKKYRNLKFDKSVLKEEVVLNDPQPESINFGINRSYSFNFDQAGIGKTITSVALFSTWFKEGFIDSIFIIARTGLDYHWLTEILKFSNIFTENDICIIDNESKVQPFKSIQNKKIIIIQNHLLADCFLSYRKDYKRGMKKSNLKWKKYVDIKKEWNKEKIALIVDEAHEISNPSAVVTKALLSHSEQFYFKYFLTATPNTDEYEKIWTLFQLADPNILNCSFDAFKLQLADKIGTKYSDKKITKYNKNKYKEVQEIIKEYSVRHLKKDYFKTNQDVRTVMFRLSPEHRMLYKLFFKEEIYKLEEDYDKITFKLIFNKFSYLLQIIENPLLLKDRLVNEEFNKYLSKWKIEKDPRFSYLGSVLNDVSNQGKKVLVFDNHPLTLDILAQKFSKYKPLIIHGKTKDSKEQRELKMNQFNDPKHDSKVMFCSTQAGGVGGNYNGACSRIEYWSIPYGSRLFSQSLERVWRTNSTEDSLVNIMLMNGTIDTIRYNRNTFKLILDENLLNMELSENDLKELLQGVMNF